MKAISKLLSTLSCSTIMLAALVSNCSVVASAENSSVNNYSDRSWLYEELSDLGLSDEIITRALSNQIDLSEVQTRSGSCFYYSVMSNGASFTYASTSLLFDMMSASYYGFTSGEAASANSIAVSTTGPMYNNLTYMSISQTYSSSNVVTPYGSLCNFKFKGSAASFLTTTSHSSITFEFISPGDVNCDGTLNLSDISMLLQYIDNLNSGITNKGKVAADCNGDGAVNDVDATILARFLAEDNTVVFW